MPDRPARILVVGLGGLGGVVAATLAGAGAPLDAWARRPETRNLVRSRGLLLEDRRGSRPVRVPVVDTPAPDTYAYVLLAVPPDAVAAAARAALPWLAPGGALVPLANGLPEERLAPDVGPERLIGAVVDLSASAPEPGVAVRHTPGRIVVGRLAGPPDDATRRLVDLLAPQGDVRATVNLRGARWAKLALNATLSSMVTAAGVPFGALLRRAPLRRLALQLFGEVNAVAKAEGVVLETAGGPRVDRLGIPPGATPGRSSLVAHHAALVARLSRYRRSRSSMLAQLERGLVPPVAFLNGEVVTRAATHGIPVPANAALLDGVLALARGGARSSLETLERIAAAAR